MPGSDAERQGTVPRACLISCKKPPMSSEKPSANALIHETSPYLLQHAYNPVAWLPWGEEALGRAKSENKPPPSAFVKLPDNVPEYNLNGTKRKPKTEKPRKFESKFQRHIPYIKIVGMRVQLSNKESKFEKKKIKWTSKIHYGPPKNHKEKEIDNAKIENHITSYKTLTDTNFSQLKKDSLKEFSKAPSSEEFHRRYIMREREKTCPETSIEIVKRIVDKTFPAEKFQQTPVPDSKKLIKGHSADIPIRVLAALYVSNILVLRIKSQS